MYAFAKNFHFHVFPCFIFNYTQLVIAEVEAEVEAEVVEVEEQVEEVIEEVVVQKRHARDLSFFEDSEVTLKDNLTIPISLTNYSTCYTC